MKQYTKIAQLVQNSKTPVRFVLDDYRLDGELSTPEALYFVSTDKARDLFIVRPSLVSESGITIKGNNEGRCRLLEMLLASENAAGQNLKLKIGRIREAVNRRIDEITSGENGRVGYISDETWIGATTHGVNWIEPHDIIFSDSPEAERFAYCDECDCCVSKEKGRCGICGNAVA